MKKNNTTIKCSILDKDGKRCKKLATIEVKVFFDSECHFVAAHNECGWAIIPVCDKHNDILAR